jgi:hypothetical protein
MPKISLQTPPPVFSETFSCKHGHNFLHVNGSKIRWILGPQYRILLLCRLWFVLMINYFRSNVKNWRCPWAKMKFEAAQGTDME